MKSSDDRVDVLIAGAGMIGATLANALSGHGLRVVVLDKNVPDMRMPDTYDLRVSALGLGTQRIFERLGVWADMKRVRVSPFQAISVWDADSDGTIEFHAADIGVPYLGHIVENQVVTAALLGRVAGHEDVVLRCPAELLGVEPRPDGVVARLADREIHAELLVGADGSQSAVRTALAIPVHAEAYAQSAIVARVETSEPHRQAARQRFLASGPLAFLPLADGACSIVWSVDDPLGDTLLALDDAAFAERLGAAFEHRLGAITAVGTRRAFPLKRAEAGSDVGPRTVLLGDAAHTVHPLAGQGANLGIADAAALAEVLLDAHRRGRAIGGDAVLRHYARWRQSENRLMIDALHGLKLLFASRSAAVRALRGAGLCLTDRSGPIKNAIMRRAVGLSGDLPRLARGQPLAG